MSTTRYRLPSTDDALAMDDATGVARRIAEGDISSLEAVDAAIERMRHADPVLHAMVCERFDAARAEARRSPALKGKTGQAGQSINTIFAGVPSAIKDNTDLVGHPTLHGSRAMPSKAAAKNAAFADQFLGTGLIALGKTKLPEFGLTATTEFVHGEPVHNPWHTGHSAGGSSGGAAALVAAGVLPIAHANDGGGSIRIPAACCGLVGLKVSRGRVADNDMAKDLPINIISDGVVSHSVRDTANFFAAVERRWPAKHMPPLGLVEGPGKEKLRIGFTSQLPDGDDAHPECCAGMLAAAKLCESLGHAVEEIPSPLSPQRGDDFLLYYSAICASLAYAGRWVIDKDFKSKKLEPLTQQLARHFRRNILKFPAALWRLKQGPKIYSKVMADYDVLLSPTLGQPPPPLDYLKPDLPFEDAWQRLRNYAAFTPTSNICGTPAISLPLAHSEQGLPIGIQFAADFGQEKRLLSLAFALEEAAPWQKTTRA